MWGVLILEASLVKQNQCRILNSALQMFKSNEVFLIVYLLLNSLDNLGIP
ncbi:hypothetical protein PLO_1362 [Pediococcus acidilactici NGRI 0510Q]|nr:hypothetical protein PLO_1362 [Pediococcus acidilactici NGRI 0510Q]